MKVNKFLMLAAVVSFISVSSFAQNKTENINVSGVCGMCKKKIEAAAKSGGAETATWNKDTKVLTITYNSATTNTANIEQKVAGAGYDTQDVKASDEAYKSLEKCCQYSRDGSTTNTGNMGNKMKSKNGKMKCKDGDDCCNKKKSS